MSDFIQFHKDALTLQECSWCDASCTLAMSVRLCKVIFCRLFIDPKASLACLLKALCLRVLTLILTCVHICERNLV